MEGSESVPLTNGSGSSKAYGSAPEHCVLGTIYHFFRTLFPVDPAKAVDDALILLILGNMLVGVLNLQQNLHSNSFNQLLNFKRKCTLKNHFF